MENNQITNYCFQFFEPMAINFAVEIANSIISISPKSKILFVIPWPETAEIFKAKIDNLKGVHVLKDPALDIFSASDDSELTSWESSELIRMDEQYRNVGGVWGSIYEDRHILYSVVGPYIKRFSKRTNRNILLRMSLARFTSIENALSKHEITKVCYLTQDFGTPLGAILAKVAKNRGVEIKVPLISRIGGYVYIADDLLEFPSNIEQEYRKLLAEGDSTKSEAIEIVKSLREGVFRNYYDFTKSTQEGLAKKLKKGISQIRAQKKHRIKGYFNSYISRAIGRYLSRIRFKVSSFFIKTVNLSELGKQSYVYYPLHVEPELNLLMLAPYYGDQLQVIRNIALSLPVDTMLIVKEHPLTRGAFPIDFYRRINQMPNVRLLSLSENQGEIIKRSSAVVVISGTAGLEALIYGKRAITLGNVFFNVCESVENVTEWGDFREALQDAIKNSPNDNDVFSFVQAVVNNSHLFDLLSIGKTEMLEGSEELKCKVRAYLSMVGVEV